MPIYEYQCESCGQRTEVMQRISDDPLTLCEVCSGPLKKLISAPSFQFKGSGWYVTDYARGDGKGKDGGDADKSADKKSGDDGGKTESAKKEDGGTSSNDTAKKSDTGTSSDSGKNDVKKAS